MGGGDEAQTAEQLAGLEARLGYAFRDRSLLETALRHASFANEAEGCESNERLEFLGDAVIGLVVARLLYQAFPSWREGDLTRAQSRLVDRAGLAGLARTLEVGSAIRLGRTERQTAGSNKVSILANTMEALLGAMYLDGGIEPVTDLASRVFEHALKADAAPVERDPKTRFQEAVMAAHGEFPSYTLVDDSGIEGDDRRFTVRTGLGSAVWSEGVGRTKRAAEQAAANAAMRRLEAGDFDPDSEPAQ